MKTYLYIFRVLFFIISAITLCCSCSEKKAEHVVFIGLDGWGAYSLPKADMPNVKKLMSEGAYTLKKRSSLPSSSAINWASMFMGQVQNCTDILSGVLKLQNFHREN